MAFDYYYSHLLEIQLKKSCKKRRKTYRETFVNGIKYTEKIQCGIIPLSNRYNDNKKVFSGYGIDIIKDV